MFSSWLCFPAIVIAFSLFAMPVCASSAPLRDRGAELPIVRSELTYRIYLKNRTYQMVVIDDASGRLKNICADEVCWNVDRIIPVIGKVETEFLKQYRVLNIVSLSNASGGQDAVGYGLYIEHEASAPYTPRICKQIARDVDMTLRIHMLLEKGSGLRSATISCNGIGIYEFVHKQDSNETISASSRHFDFSYAVGTLGARWWQAVSDFGNGPFQLEEIPSDIRRGDDGIVYLRVHGASHEYELRMAAGDDGRLRHVCLGHQCIDVERNYPEIAAMKFVDIAEVDGAVFEANSIGRVVGVALPVVLPPAERSGCVVAIPWAKGMPSRVAFFWRDDGRLLEVVAKRPAIPRNISYHNTDNEPKNKIKRCVSDETYFRYFDVTPDMSR